MFPGLFYPIFAKGERWLPSNLISKLLDTQNIDMQSIEMVPLMKVVQLRVDADFALQAHHQAGLRGLSFSAYARLLVSTELLVGNSLLYERGKTREAGRRCGLPKSDTLQARMPFALWKQAKSESKKQGCSLSTYVRRLLAGAPVEGLSDSPPLLPLATG